jgi:hypothetical protein
VWDVKDEWLGEIKVRRRLTEHVLRKALIQSCCNCDPEITQASLEAAMRIVSEFGYPRLANWLSVIVFIYVTSHGFILPMCGPGAAMLVPRAPQH